MEELRWQDNYNELKHKTQKLKITGLSISKEEQLNLTEDMKRLNRSLKTIQDSPMEYEMYAKTKVMLETLKLRVNTMFQ